MSQTLQIILKEKNGQQSTADRFPTISTLSYSAIGINSSSFAE